jgi:hypothetical protein
VRSVEEVAAVEVEISATRALRLEAGSWKCGVRNADFGMAFWGVKSGFLGVKSGAFECEMRNAECGIGLNRWPTRIYKFVNRENAKFAPGASVPA